MEDRENSLCFMFQLILKLNKISIIETIYCKHGLQDLFSANFTLLDISNDDIFNLIKIYVAVVRIYCASNNNFPDFFGTPIVE